MRLAVTIDTEADGQWSPGVPITVRNAEFWDPFQDLCERHGVAPTYLVASEILEDDRARSLLEKWAQRGAAEVGAHLHPWTTPPFVDRPGLRYNDPVHAFPCQLPDELLREKTRLLTEQLTAAFRASPTSYRAGRFGLDARGAGFLQEAGYVVDSSVTPLTSWSAHPGLDGEGGPDFRRHTPEPFRIDTHGPNTLIEVPVTILPTYAVLRRMPLLLRAYRTLPARAIRKTLLSRWLVPQPMWLSPDPRYMPKDLGDAWHCASHEGLEAAVMMFHSSELMPGGSPFWPDARSVRNLLTSLDALFSLLRREGGEFSTLTGLATGLDAARLPVRPL